jgi:hypothetical protein
MRTRVSTSAHALAAGLLLCTLGLAQGCIFSNVSAEETLRDAVVGLNDEVRWNRLDLATQRVAPGYRAAFRLTHLDWHEHMKIADSEIVHVQVGEDRSEAKAYVAIRWYDERTMLLAETTLEQEWHRAGRAYVLVGEKVRNGDPRLLELPEEEDAEDDEDDGEDEAGDGDEEPTEVDELDEEPTETAARRRRPAG